MVMKSKTERMEDPQFFDAIRELCTLCARGVVTIANRYNFNARDVNKLFIELYTKIDGMVDNSKP